MKKGNLAKTEINCPDCGKFIMYVDVKAKSTLNAICKKCKKLVIYDGQTKKSKTSELPKRNCSSGMRFY